MLCFLCNRARPATHYGRAIEGPFILPVCSTCAPRFDVVPMPAARLVPLTAPWWEWMNARGNAAARRMRLRKAAHVFMETNREPA
jgi:hypothetical protein